MSIQSDNRFMVEKINKWFNITSTVQIIFIVATIAIFPPVSILEIILCIVMSKKTRSSVIVNIIGNIIISSVFTVYYFIRIFGDKTESGVEVLLKLVDIALAMAFISSLLIVGFCIRALFYARDLDFLRQLDGYPYFLESRNVNCNKAAVNSKSNSGEISAIRTVNIEIQSAENSDFVKYGVRSFRDASDSLINKNLSGSIGIAKIMSVLIMVADIVVGITFSDKLAGLNGFVEFSLLIFILVHPKSNRLLVGFQLHVIETILLISLTKVGMFGAVLLILNIIQTVVYFAAYNKCCKTEDGERKRIKESHEVIHNNEEHITPYTDEYVEVNGVYKKKLHVQLKKKND